MTELNHNDNEKAPPDDRSENSAIPIVEDVNSDTEDIGVGAVPERVVSPQPVEEFEPEVFVDGKRVYQVDTTPAEALVIHCGDPRFQSAFRSFVTSELGIRSYTPVIIGGGIHAFGAQSFLPKNFKILWEQVKFFVREQNLRRVIIINHDDCRWYEKMKGYHGKITLPVKGKLDLRTAALLILKDFAGVKVSTYWADLDGDRITFREVTDHS